MAKSTELGVVLDCDYRQFRKAATEQCVELPLVFTNTQLN